MKDKKINLSKNLIYLRRKKRLSIEQVAGEIGVSRQAVSKWETGETLRTITGVTRRFYPNWDQSAYQRYLSVFDLDEQKQVRQLSEGMKVKYRIALALSHGARLFLFDEPTSGLDPVAREELLELFFTCQFAREMVSVGGAGGQGVHCSHRPGASADRPDGGGGTPARSGMAGQSGPCGADPAAAHPVRWGGGLCCGQPAGIPHGSRPF